MDAWPETDYGLLAKLGNWGRTVEWRRFFQTYAALIVRLGVREGLTVEEARDALQETLFNLSRQMATGRYDPNQGKFRAWLRRLARWQIHKQFRKRAPATETRPGSSADAGEEAEPEPPEGFEAVADPAGLGAFDEMWAEEEAAFAREAADQRVRRRAEPRAYAIYDLLVAKGWAVEKVAAMHQLTPDAVYQIKHRVGEMVQAELAKLDPKGDELKG